MRGIRRSHAFATPDKALSTSREVAPPPLVACLLLGWWGFPSFFPFKLSHQAALDPWFSFCILNLNLLLLCSRLAVVAHHLNLNVIFVSGLARKCSYHVKAPSEGRTVPLGCEEAFVLCLGLEDHGGESWKAAFQACPVPKQRVCASGREDG